MKKQQIIKNVGKGSREEELPNRFARTELTNGDALQRAMNNYAKKAPRSDMSSIFMMGMRAR
jgi:hypothetical protein